MEMQNKHNVLYFESSSMVGLYQSINKWQESNNKRLLSISVQPDGDSFCCIAITNPTEVVITDEKGRPLGVVDNKGKLELCVCDRHVANKVEDVRAELVNLG